MSYPYTFTTNKQRAAAARAAAVAARSAASDFFAKAKYTFTDLQVHALRFWYNQYHLLEILVEGNNGKPLPSNKDFEKFILDQMTLSERQTLSRRLATTPDSPNLAARAELTSEQLVEFLLAKMRSADEVKIFRERLDLILTHYPERVRWNNKMRAGVHVGYAGSGLDVGFGGKETGGHSLDVDWEEVTEEEKGFKWWW